LMYLLSGSVILFGVISASYFGVALSQHNPLNKLMLMDFGSKEGQNQIMLLSIIMGMIHISISLAIKVKRQRDWPSLGWILVIWAGYFLVKARMTGGHEHPAVLYVLIAGLAVVFLFTSQSRNPLMRILGGLNGVLGIVQVFSDVLSYLRLFALGIATVYMAQTFNMLAEGISQSVPWLGYVLAGLVLLVGHLVNLGLGVMGGVIHGLRLNFLEWYRWSFEGDGMLFKPFRLTGQPRNQ
jgi:V/A-type H+/Na+-transporting ATPase subunit I